MNNKTVNLTATELETLIQVIEAMKFGVNEIAVLKVISSIYEKLKVEKMPDDEVTPTPTTYRPTYQNYNS